MFQDVYQGRKGLHNNGAGERKSTNTEKREKQHCRYTKKRNNRKNKVIITNLKKRVFNVYSTLQFMFLSAWVMVLCSVYQSLVYENTYSPVISQTFLTIYLVKQILEMKVFLRPGTTDIVNVCKIDAKGRLKKAPTQKHYLLTLLPPPPSFGPNA